MSFWLTLVALIMIVTIVLWMAADELGFERLADVFVTLFYLQGIVEFILIVVAIIIKLCGGCL